MRLWRTAGGPIDEMTELLALLCELNLVRNQADVYQRTRAGDIVVRALRVGNLRAFGLVLIRSGAFHDQARTLIEGGAMDPTGNLKCPARIARAGAPQLLGVLRWWPDVRLLPEVTIPHELISELNTVWALLPPSVAAPIWAVERKAVGNRAEMYTVQTERLRSGDPSQIIWAALDSDSLGWDVEDRSASPRRFIEVKGRRDNQVTFFVSDNEWAKAQELGAQYEIQFWGGIDLGKDPAVEYHALKAAGYPLFIINPAVELQQLDWEMRPVSWRVSRVGR